MTTQTATQSSWFNFQHIEDELSKFYKVRDIAMQEVVNSYKNSWGHNKRWLMDLIKEIPAVELSREFFGQDARAKNFFYDMKNQPKEFTINFMCFPDRVQALKPFIAKNGKHKRMVYQEIRRLGRLFGRSVEIVDFDGWFALSVGGLKNTPKKK